jgi:hypothetical protein
VNVTPVGGEPSGRPGRLLLVTTIDMPRVVRVLLVGATWVLATLFGLGVAATTTIGPTVLRLSYNHGVHLGDLVAFGGAYVVAALITASVLDGHQKRLGHQNRK